MKITEKYLVFTDLDGTLLNHHNYEYQAVLPVIERIKQQGSMVILNSSKTLAELSEWREKLSLSTPLIAENGGVISMRSAQGEVKYLIGKPYRDICFVLNQLRQQYGWKFLGFNDWNPVEVMAKTGLEFIDAQLAKKREVTEPIQWLDSDENLAHFKTALAGFGLTLNRGGRFYHVMASHDKSTAMDFLRSSEAFKPFKQAKVIALGDGENDLAMLNAADIAAVLPPDSGQSLQVPNAYYSKQYAPNGWVEAIEFFLNK